LPYQIFNRLLTLTGLVILLSLLIFGFALIPRSSIFYVITNNRLLVLITGITVYFILKIAVQKKNLLFGWYDLLFLSFIALTFFSQFWARNPLDAVSVTFSWLFFYSVFKFVQDWISHSSCKKCFSFFLQIILIFNLVIIVHLFFSKGFSIDNYTLKFTKQQVYELTSMLKIHRNHIAVNLVAMSGIAWCYLLINKQKYKIALGLIVFFLILFSLLIIRSRGGIVTLTGLFIIYNLYSAWKNEYSWSIVVIVIIVSIITFKFVSSFQQNEHEYLYLIDPLYGVKSEQGDERLHLWKISIQLLLEKPIWGYGSGAWLYEYMKYGVGDFRQIDFTDTHFVTTHNVFINVLFCNGIIGFAIFFFLIIFYPLHQFYKNKINNSSHIIIALFGLLGVLSMMQFYGKFDIRGGYLGGAPLMLFIFLGVLIKDNSLQRWRIPKLLIIASGFCVIGYYLSTRANVLNRVAFDRLLKIEDYESCERMLENFDKNKIDFSQIGCTENYLKYQLMEKIECRNKAIEYLEKHLSIHPYNFINWYELGIQNQKLELYDSAILCFENALLYNCDYVKAKVGLYFVHTLSNNTEEANKYKNEFYEMEYYLKEYQINEHQWKYFPKAKRKKLFYEEQLKKIEKFDEEQNSKLIPISL